LLALAIITFCVAVSLVYGFRASLVSFWLVGNGNSTCHSKKETYDILVQVALMGLDLWYLAVSLFFKNLRL
jgi:hypothetical protein